MYLIVDFKCERKLRANCYCIRRLEKEAARKQTVYVIIRNFRVEEMKVFECSDDEIDWSSVDFDKTPFRRPDGTSRCCKGIAENHA